MQRTIVILLLVVAGLATTDLVRDLCESRPEAHGQAVGAASSGYIMATGVDETGNTPVVFVLDPREHTLGAYTATKTGIDFLGSRRIAWDLQWDELSFGIKDRREDKSPKEIRKMLSERGIEPHDSKGKSGTKKTRKKSKSKGSRSVRSQAERGVLVQRPKGLLDF